MTGHAVSLRLKQSDLYGSFFSKSQQNQTFVHHLRMVSSCLLSLLAPFLLSQGSHVHVPYGLHIWSPVQALLGGKNKISFEVLHKYISVQSATAHVCKYLGPKFNA